jgi:hypothetical protein
MRLWSLHPKYLDTKGLVALWRESLLARKVLTGKTRGYKNHPQLIRFKNSKNPTASINYYISTVFEEAQNRGYLFDKKKLNVTRIVSSIKITSGQLRYELEHLKRKLYHRDYKKFKKINKLKTPKPNPLFTSIRGKMEHWEKNIS